MILELEQQPRPPSPIIMGTRGPQTVVEVQQSPQPVEPHSLDVSKDEIQAFTGCRSSISSSNPAEANAGKHKIIPATVVSDFIPSSLKPLVGVRANS
jgi:hypothetical protein